MTKIWWWLRGIKKLKTIRNFLHDAHQFACGSGISKYAHFSSKPCLPHGLSGIFISGGARIGNDCVIFHQVTIGSNTLIDSRFFGAPEIGDNCYIGAGAKIVGGIKIGNNVRIGANAVVYQDVPDDSVVIGGRMKVFSRPNMDNRFYSFPGKWVCHEGGRVVDVIDERLDILNNIKL